MGVKPLSLVVFHGRWIDLHLLLLWAGWADWWKCTGSETHSYRLFIVSELIFIFLNWWKRNGSKTHFLSAFHGRWIDLHLLLLWADRADWWKCNESETHFYRLFNVSELIFIFLNWWKRNGSKTHFYRLSMVDDLVLIFLSWRLADRRRDRSMGAAHIFLLIHSDYLFFLCHDDEVISLLAHFFSEEADCRWPALGAYPSFICYSYRWYTNRRTVDTSWSEATCPTLLFSSHLARFSSLVHRSWPWWRVCGSMAASSFSPYLAWQQPGGGMNFFCAHSMGEKPGGASFFSCVACGGSLAVQCSLFSAPLSN
jgi:hypothetical protein